jgi:hypothetical protein
VSLEAAQDIVGSMMGLSRRWAETESAEDHPFSDPASKIHLDELTDELWTAVSDSLQETGIDL